jgi:hypothetical protein
MKELLKNFENLWVSVAFAEAGEHETSRELLVGDAFDEESPEICPVV